MTLEIICVRFSMLKHQSFNKTKNLIQFFCINFFFRRFSENEMGMLQGQKGTDKMHGFY